ncbi:hypothetical protein WBG78_23085 [Chryseolinea sp. T2]|uniref:hypothetical protein n=1 Tax=Chryseolinea sp. T2 TaxID=3129255 RepID=UPI003078988B
MDIQRLPNGWLFERHPEAEIRRWINNLKYSYFKRAWGGHANDGDEFILALTCKDKHDLLNIFARLNIELKSIPKDHPKPIPGKPYTSGEYSAFKSEIREFPEYEQPKHIEIHGTKCFCWVENRNINFTFSGGRDGNLYEVSETDFENCKRLEEVITNKGLTDKVSRDCESSVTCISRKRYPDLFVA